MRTLENMIAEHPFCFRLDPGHVGLLAECACEVHYDEDEFVFHAQEAANRFYLLVQGSVALKVHVPHLGPMPIQTVNAGEALGWSWLTPPYQWHFDARVIQRVQAIAMDADVLRRTLAEHCDLGYELLRRVVTIVAQRLQATRLQLLDVYEVRT